MPSFGFSPDIAEFHCLLSVFCRLGRGAPAHAQLEGVLLGDQELQGHTHGWCNIVCSVREAKRFWNAMENLGIGRDVLWYGTTGA